MLKKWLVIVLFTLGGILLGFALGLLMIGGF